MTSIANVEHFVDDAKFSLPTASLSSEPGLRLNNGSAQFSWRLHFEFQTKLGKSGSGDGTKVCHFAPSGFPPPFFLCNLDISTNVCQVFQL